MMHVTYSKAYLVATETYMWLSLCSSFCQCMYVCMYAMFLALWACICNVLFTLQYFKPGSVDTMTTTEAQLSCI